MNIQVHYEYFSNDVVFNEIASCHRHIIHETEARPVIWECMMGASCCGWRESTLYCYQRSQYCSPWIKFRRIISDYFLEENLTGVNPHLYYLFLDQDSNRCRVGSTLVLTSGDPGSNPGKANFFRSVLGWPRSTHTSWGRKE